MYACLLGLAPIMEGAVQTQRKGLVPAPAILWTKYSLDIKVTYSYYYICFWGVMEMCVPFCFTLYHVGTLVSHKCNNAYINLIRKSHLLQGTLDTVLWVWLKPVGLFSGLWIKPHFTGFLCWQISPASAVLFSLKQQIPIIPDTRQDTIANNQMSAVNNVSP